MGHLSPFRLTPTPPGTCPQYAVSHDQSQPHNRDSLAYQYYFYGEHGRWPTWEDAMAHCPAEVRALWREELRKRGVSLGFD